LTNRVSITLTTTIAASAGTVWQYPPDDCHGTPATMRLMLQRNGDDLTGDYGRFWATVGLLLAPGTRTITVPLTPEAWSSVNGKRGDTVPQEFASLLADVGNIGVTFGGGCFFGHGVWVTGAARITIDGMGVLG
jgi:hypothetical protein